MLASKYLMVNNPRMTNKSTGEQVTELQSRLDDRLASFVEARKNLLGVALSAKALSIVVGDSVSDMAFANGGYHPDDRDFASQASQLGTTAEHAWQELHKPVIELDKIVTQ